MTNEECNHDHNFDRFKSVVEALRAYRYENSSFVYDKDTMEKFCHWLYARPCPKDCPFFRIVEGEGFCSPRCTNPIGRCWEKEDRQ